MNQHEAIIQAFEKLGGTRTIGEIRTYVRAVHGDRWKDFGTRMADMVPLELGGSPSSSVAEEFRRLRRVSKGRYILVVGNFSREKSSTIRQPHGVCTVRSEEASQVMQKPESNRTQDSRVKHLLDFSKQIQPRELFPVLHPEAAILIEENPFAFALAAVLDRGTKSEIIWTIPYYLQEQVGELSPNFFASKSIEELMSMFGSLQMKPRYINAAPYTVKELSEIVVNEYDGDVEEIWRNKPSNYVEGVFQRIYGVGPGISSMVVLLLERCFGIHFNDVDHRNMDVKPDTHIIRVFHRLGFTSQPSETEALEAARRLNSEYPGALDAPAWIVGKKWCTSVSPKCNGCPLTKVCPKHVT